MIWRTNYWYEIWPLDYEERPGRTAGKWLYFGEKDILHSYVKKLNQYVESGELRAAKVAMKHPDYDPFPEKYCVMCIFTTGSKEHKDNTKAFIKEKFRIEPAAWKSEEQTEKDWSSEGWLKLQADLTTIKKGIEQGYYEDIAKGIREIRQLINRLHTHIYKGRKPIDSEIKLLETVSSFLDEFDKKPEFINNSDAFSFNRIKRIEKQIEGLIFQVGNLMSKEPKNIYNIQHFNGTVSNSAFQQGTENSNQFLTIDENEIDSISKFLLDLNKKLPDLDLNQDNKSEIGIDVQTIETQLKSKTPKRVIVEESLRSIRNVLEGATGSLLASGLLNQLMSIM